MHNLSGSFWSGKVCLQSFGGCAFLKGACFPSLLPFCIQFPNFTYGFSCGSAPPFDKGARAGGTEMPTFFYPSVLSSLILIPDHPQHPLCTHHLLLCSSPGGAWAECTRHQARYQCYLCSCRCTRQQGQVVQADCYTLEQSCIFGILNTLKVYKPACRWNARCQLLTHMASTVLLAPWWEAAQFHLSERNGVEEMPLGSSAGVSFLVGLSFKTNSAHKSKNGMCSSLPCT